jgi:outer membrane protein assembly factor BamA
MHSPIEEARHLRSQTEYVSNLFFLGILIGFLLAAGGPNVVSAQPEGVEQDTTITDWTVLPVVFHTPETGTGGGIAGAYFYKVHAEEKPSSIKWIAFYTEKKQIILELTPERYLSGGSRRLLATIGFQDYPDVFYGIGSGTSVDEEENYREKSFYFEVSYELELRRNLRIGPRLAFRRSHVTEIEEDGKLAGGRIPGIEKHRNVSIGLVLVHDGRDNILYTMNGSYLRVSTNYSGDITGSDHRYSRHSLDLRHFFGFGSRQAVGLRAHFGAAEGSTPFQLLPGLGGDKMMRGFPDGRFRDNLGYVGQAEYRLNLKWRLGFAAFMALGDVASDIGGFTGSKVKYSGGAGMRLRLNDEGLNLRLDLGFTEEGSGFYFVAEEAF